VTVVELERETAHIEILMERLNSRRALLQRRINALSLISQLPAEILTEIFRLTCQLSETTHHVITPLFFGGICKEWRALAWSTPLLWNIVSLKVSRKTHGSQINVLGEWLLRAKTSPLFIKLTSDDEHESIFCSLRDIMGVLVTRSAYWYSLDCLLPPQCHDVLKSHEFPLLTSVALRPPKGTISTFSEPPSMFLSAPKLVDVDLSGYNFSAMVLPWEQLKRFKTQFLTVAECLKVLRRSPSLKECHLRSVYSPEIFDSLPSETLYSDLERLDVFLVKSAAISLLDNLTLPHLCELNIGNSGSGEFLYSAVCALISRSSCHLQRLSIDHRDGIKDDDLIACLEKIPSVTHLRLVSDSANSPSFTGLSDKLITRFRSSHGEGEHPLLPKLVSFEYWGSVSCDGRLLVDVLSERWRAPQYGTPGLKTAKIIAGGHYDISDDIDADLCNLMAEGMQVEVCSIWGILLRNARQSPWFE
jgi:hypothetical protein